MPTDMPTGTETEPTPAVPTVNPVSVNKINDGGRAYGSSSLLIYKFSGTAYVSRGTYLTDDFGATQPMTSKEYTDSDDIPIGQVSVRGLLTGKATLQFATSTTPQVQIGDVFKWTYADPAGPFSWYFYIDSVERTERKGEECKQPVTFRQVLNPSAFGVTAPGAAEVIVNLVTAIP